MKRFFVFCVILLSLVACRDQPSKVYADYSVTSGYDIESADQLALENLEVLCRVWGYVKYHHPVFADTVFQIDYELFELLPDIVHANKDMRNASLKAWIDRLGPFRCDKNRYKSLFRKSAEYIQVADLDWIGDEQLLGPELSETLQRMRYAARSRGNHYLVLHFKDGNIDFENEARYPQVQDVDCGFRLLGFFRYWNIVEYFLPNKRLMSKEWGNVLTEYLPQFVNVMDNYEYREVFSRLFTELHDTHSSSNATPIKASRRLPLAVGFVEDKLVVLFDEFDQMNWAKLNVGDEILAVDNMFVDSLITLTQKYVSVSNREGLLSQTASYGMMTDRARLPVKFQRGGIIYDTILETVPFEEYTETVQTVENKKKPYYFINDSVGYIYTGSYSNSMRKDIMKAFQDTHAIIVDLRCYPADFMIYQLVDRHFMPRRTPVAIFMNPELQFPGYFYQRPLSIGSFNPKAYKGKVIVLANEESISQSEYTVMAFQALPKTVVVGSTTAGADGNISYLYLPGGITTIITGMGINYPDGMGTQGIGVRIDYEVNPTLEGIRAGRDEFLEAAVKLATTP